MLDFNTRYYVRRAGQDILRLETIKPSPSGKTVRCRVRWSTWAGSPTRRKWGSVWVANYKQSTLDKMLEVGPETTPAEAMRLLLDEEAAR